MVANGINEVNTVTVTAQVSRDLGTEGLLDGQVKAHEALLDLLGLRGHLDLVVTRVLEVLLKVHQIFGMTSSGLMVIMDIVITIITTGASMALAMVMVTMRSSREMDMLLKARSTILQIMMLDGMNDVKRNG